MNTRNRSNIKRVFFTQTDTFHRWCRIHRSVWCLPFIFIFIPRKIFQTKTREWIKIQGIIWLAEMRIEIFKIWFTVAWIQSLFLMIIFYTTCPCLRSSSINHASCNTIDIQVYIQPRSRLTRKSTIRLRCRYRKILYHIIIHHNHWRSQGRGLGGPVFPPFQGTDLNKSLNYGIPALNLFSLSMINLSETQREVNNLFNNQFNFCR